VGPVVQPGGGRSRDSGPRKQRILTMVVLSGVLLGEAIFLLLLSPGEDFWQHYTAANAIRHSRALMPICTDGGWPPYVYPGFTAVLFLPLSFFPPRMAFTAWVGILYSATAASTYLFATRVASLDRQLAMFATLGSLVWPVTFVAVFMGQATPLVTLILVATYALGQRGRFRPAGFALSLALFKPHVVAPVAAGLTLRRKWALVGSFLAGAMVLAGVSVGTGLNTCHGTWSSYILGWFLGGANSVSLPGFELVPLPGRLLLAACGYCALAVWLLRKAAIHPEDAAIAFVASLLFSPYVPGYDLVLLTPIFALLINRWDPFFWLAMVLSSSRALGYGPAGFLTLSMGCFGLALLRFRRAGR
jgi:hypothetical protein